MGLRSRIYQWFWQGWRRDSGIGLTDVYRRDEEVFFKGDVKLTVKAATNGRLLTMQLHKPANGPGDDWETTMYLVPEGESLIGMITKALVAAKVKE